MKGPAAYSAYPQPHLESGTPLDWPYWCAMNLLKYPIDQAISQQLTQIGKASGVDRAWMIEYHTDLLRFSKTHEWCKGQAKPFISEIQGAPTTLIAWLHKYMVKGQTVAVHDVNRLPHTARAIQAEFLRQSNKSVLSAPVFHDRELCGVIGFDATTEYRTWPAAQIHALQQCANLIGQAKYAGRHDSRPTAVASTEPVVYLNMHGLTRGVRPKSIIGVRSAGNYSKVWLEDGTMVFDSHTFGTWSALLPSAFFLQVHRTAVVNTLHVRDVDHRQADKWRITMNTVSDAWPVSRQHRKALRERMGI
jgi:DNA-binding LytR/AlgR family response regulator